MGSGKEMGKTIGEVERITGIPKREIKYCIEQRLICPGKKSESGYWLYDEQEIEKLQMVVLFRRLEYPNDVIRSLISAPHIHWEQELRRQVTRLEEKHRRTEIQLTTARWLLENLAEGQMDFDLIARRYICMKKSRIEHITKEDTTMRFCIGKRTLLGVAVALLLLLSACGGQPASTESPTESGQDLATQTPEVKATQETSRKELPAFALQATMEETVLVDEKDVKITATALQGTSNQVELSLAIENNSDTDLSFLSGTMGYSCNSVNGYMIDDGYLNVDVVAGKKANETIKFSVDQLELMGITDIADIEIGFHIQTSDYDTYLRTGPRQLRTSLSDFYDYSADTYQEAINNGEFAQIYSYSMEYFAMEVPFEKNGVKVLSWGLVTNKDHEKTVFLEVENTSTDQTFLTTSNFYFNGLLVEGYTWSSEAINSEKRKVITLPLSSMLEESYWEIFGLTELGDITFSIGLENPDRQEIAPAEMVSLLLPGVQATFDTAGEEIYNENGLRIISKGLVESNSDYLNDIYVLFLAENGTAETLDIDVAYNSLSVNGYMTDFFGSGQDLAPGKSGILEVSMRGDSLEKNGIDALEKIEDLELSFMIRDDRYNTLAEPKVILYREAHKRKLKKEGRPVPFGLTKNAIISIMISMPNRNCEGIEMGRVSVKENKNQYHLAREELGLSREKASELLGTITPDRLERIENEMSLPHADEVLLMAEKYKKLGLCNYHCSQQCPIGREYVPQVEIKELSAIVLEMLASLNSVGKMKDRLVEIAADGKIETDEIDDFIYIQDELERISITVETLQLWVEKMLANGVIDPNAYQAKRRQ